MSRGNEIVSLGNLGTIAYLEGSDNILAMKRFLREQNYFRGVINLSDQNNLFSLDFMGLNFERTA